MFETARLFLSEKSIAAALPCPDGERRLWDTRLHGFLLRIWPSGRKVFYVRLRRTKRTELRMIGTFGRPWSAEDARAKAAELCASTDQQRVASRRALTVRELCDRYLAEGPLTKVNKRPSSWKTDATNLRRHVQPLLGTRYLHELSRTDVADMLRDITAGMTAGDFKTKRQGVARVRGGAGSAARVKTSISAMFNWAIRHELMQKNPAIGIEVMKTRKVERFLSDEEVGSLQRQLAEDSAAGLINPIHAEVIRLLLLTGARKSEILGLRWTEFDMPRGRLCLPPERTKSGRHNGVRYIPLSGAALAILKSLPKESEWVFPAGRKAKSGHLTGIQKTWKRVCARSGLGSMRLHDLRHSFASFAISNGESIYTISEALGHATTRMTERYLHLRDDDVRAMAERTTQRILKTKLPLTGNLSGPTLSPERDCGQKRLAKKDSPSLQKSRTPSVH